MITPKGKRYSTYQMKPKNKYERYNQEPYLVNIQRHTKLSIQINSVMMLFFIARQKALSGPFEP